MASRGSLVCQVKEQTGSHNAEDAISGGDRQDLRKVKTQGENGGAGGRPAGAEEQAAARRAQRRPVRITPVVTFSC